MMVRRLLLISTLVSALLLLYTTVSITFSQLQGPLTSASISNGIACVEINNPLPYGGGVTLRWTKFMVAFNGGNPCNYPNLFLGDLTAGEELGGLRYSPYTDTTTNLNPEIFVANNSTIIGVINSNGIRERMDVSLEDYLPVVFINFTLSGLPQPTNVWYGVSFISSIWVTTNPGETAWVVAMGVGNYSFPAQDPVKMYNLAVNWGFNVSTQPSCCTPGQWTFVYIPVKKGEFVWMEIDNPNVGTYYLAFYPLTSADSFILTSNNGWGFDKIIGIVFAENVTSAKGALLAVSGNSLSNVYQNINDALNILGESTQHTATMQYITAIPTILLVIIVIIVVAIVVMIIALRRAKNT